MINLHAFFKFKINIVDGIAGDEHAHRFEDTWNAVYSNPSLQVPWYLIAGNHDHYGNVTAEVAYTAVNSRWNFESLFYSKRFDSVNNSVSIDMIFIDTIELSGNTAGYEYDEDYYNKLEMKPRSAAEDQWSWIEVQLAASTADYLIVAGHYPVYSVCQHGNTDNLLLNLKPLLVQYGAHYMSGHDHCMYVPIII